MRENTGFQRPPVLRIFSVTHSFFDHNFTAIPYPRQVISRQVTKTKTKGQQASFFVLYYILTLLIYCDYLFTLLSTSRFSLNTLSLFKPSSFAKHYHFLQPFHTPYLYQSYILFYSSFHVSTCTQSTIWAIKTTK